MLWGTPHFMAPEVLLGAPAGVRADLYSLGVVLFALVTGSMPVRASSLEELRAKHRRDEIRHARDLRPDLPELFTQTLDRLLAGDPDHRFASAGEAERALLLSLGAVVQSPHSETPSRGWRAALPLAAAALVLLAVLGGWWWTHARPTARPVPAPFSDTPTQSILGEAPGEMLGLALARVGDVDQDGHDDILVGGPGFSQPALGGGKIYLYRGTPAGLDPRPAWTAVDTVPGARLGWSIASLTNVTFSGYPDLVVGAPGSDSANGAAGSVEIYRGSRNGFPAEPSEVLRDGGSGALFGYSIATGDVNHDGYDDLLVGEPGYPDPSRAAGRALLYLARDGAYTSQPVWIAKGPPGSRFGTSVDMSGDLNNDGYRDAVVGALNASFGPDEIEAGAAYVYLGSATGLDTIPIVIPGKQPGALAGRAVLIAGDLDGDGCADLLVGSEEASDGEAHEGAVEVHFGSKAGISVYGPSLLEPDVAGANFGGHLATLGDLDGDGHADFFVGAPRYQHTEPREGAAYVFGCSPHRELRRLWFHAGGKAGSWYGVAAASGDFNGDRKRDLVVSVPAWDNETGENVGRVDLTGPCFLRRSCDRPGTRSIPCRRIATRG